MGKLDNYIKGILGKNRQRINRCFSKEDIQMTNRHMKSHSTLLIFQFSSVQLLSRVQLFATPWIAAHQASLSITNSQSSHKLMSIESMIPFSCLIFYRPLLLLPPIPPSIWVFSNEPTLAWGGQIIGVSALASFLPMNQGLISFRMDRLDLLAVQGISRVFSNTTVQKHQFFSSQPSSQSNSHIHTWPQEKP